MNYLSIEQEARSVQMAIWKARRARSIKTRDQLLELFTPQSAAEVLGIRYEFINRLANFGGSVSGLELAGLFDRQAGKIVISDRFSPEIQKYTGAHEIGHMTMHTELVMHRDRPIGGLDFESPARSLQEREADYFAACFLMPRKIVTEAFEDNFGQLPFVFDEETAFWLSPRDFGSLLRPREDSLDRELALASTTRFKGNRVEPLCKQFRVSSKTMAIRIKELGLVA
ncbi:ImmA/IrrE family metallo-endopeptidase [Nevskia ramosa]|uniref:ImmA/IrrE family metallo-endopeptidase n=1 Tax=Nevskia ramosa TaxID=64002 RepID=UPI0023543C30|nr:ImmA/IrrE family metallo-endopeptidase [Nevskia ramosa]